MAETLRLLIGFVQTTFQILIQSCHRLIETDWKS